MPKLRMKTAAAFVLGIVTAALLPAGQAHATKCGIDWSDDGRPFDEEFCNAIRKQYHFDLLDFVNELADDFGREPWTREQIACRVAVTMFRSEAISYARELPMIEEAVAAAAAMGVAARAPITALHRWTHEVANMLCSDVMMADEVKNPEDIAEVYRPLTTGTCRYPADQWSDKRKPWRHDFVPNDLAYYSHQTIGGQMGRRKYFRAINRMLNAFGHMQQAQHHSDGSIPFRHYKHAILDTLEYPTLLPYVAEDRDQGVLTREPILTGLNFMRRQWHWELKMANHPRYLRPLLRAASPSVRDEVDRAAGFYHDYDKIPRGEL